MLPMNKEKAIQLLKAHLDKLEREGFSDSWQVSYYEYVKRFCGVDSMFYTTTFNPNVRYNSVTQELAIKKISARELINSAINHINEFGLYKKPKNPFIKSVGGAALWSALGVSIFAGLPYAYYLGGKDEKESSKKQIKKEMRDSMQLLKNRILLLTQPTKTESDEDSNNLKGR